MKIRWVKESMRNFNTAYITHIKQEVYEAIVNLPENSQPVLARSTKEE